MEVGGLTSDRVEVDAMSGPSGGGWEQQPPPPYPPRANGPQPNGPFPAPSYPSPAYGSPPPPPYSPPYSASSYPGGPPSPPGNSNRVIIAITAVVVVLMIVGGAIAVATHHSASADKTSTSASGTPSTPATVTATSSATTSASATDDDADNKDELCTSAEAQTDLIHLTVALEFTTSYAQASSYDKGIIDSCTTSASLKQLKPYFGKDFGLPGEDLTGGNDSGSTARYSVQLVNTKTFVSFTLDANAQGGGYRVVSATVT
jgi:hypothetical protein